MTVNTKITSINIMTLVLSSMLLFGVKYKVYNLSKQSNILKKSIDSTQQDIHVLKAELSYLSQPARIESLSNKYLSLKPQTVRDFEVKASATSSQPKIAPSPQKHQSQNLSKQLHQQKN